MIFVGDIASPSNRFTKDLIQSLKDHEEIFGDKLLVANLEGLLS